MPKLLALLIVLSLAVPCLAAEYVQVNQGTFVNRVIPPDHPIPPPESAPSMRAKTIGRIAPHTGLAIGLHSFYPTISYVNEFNFNEVELGYTSRPGADSMLLRGAGEFWQSYDGYSIGKLGFAVFTGPGPHFGIYAELERYLNEIDTSVSGTIYLFKAGNGQTIIGDAQFGARLYL